MRDRKPILRARFGAGVSHAAVAAAHQVKPKHEPEVTRLAEQRYGLTAPTLD